MVKRPVNELVLLVTVLPDELTPEINLCRPGMIWNGSSTVSSDCGIWRDTCWTPTGSSDLMYSPLGVVRRK